MALKFAEKYSDKEVVHRHLDTEELLKIPKLKEIFTNYDSYEWRFGQTPQFEHNLEKKFDWGLIDFHFDVKKNKIEAAKVYSDSLRPDFIDILNEELNRQDKIEY